ncbi:hypothetical protein [Chitinophaga sp. LS1]|uniref:hypothetical protein n=1 Tax=Chitinophaga sp. LS1 TaxID=3051176 RepID=UPI002AAB3953|nr:hypothetical protein [Chitinophaga sp. LS1]WPV63889.1 hypothetical protein QQL36_18995 [Chitinophaga sp. LS1]
MEAVILIFPVAIVFVILCFKHAYHVGEVDAATLKNARLNGRIFWKGAYHKVNAIRVEGFEKYCVIYTYYDENGQNLYRTSHVGDSIAKSAGSELISLYDKNGVLVGVFERK